MNLGLDDDRRQLRDSVRSVLADLCPLTVCRASYDDPTAWRDLWSTLTDLGWTGVGGGDDSGDVLDVALLAEEAGAALVPAPLLSTVGLAAPALRAAGEPAAGALAEVAAGKPAALAGDLTAAASVTDGRLAGELGPVRDAARAELLAVLARDDTGTDCLAVVREGGGVQVDAAESVDPSAPVAMLHLDVVPDLVVPVARNTALAIPLVAAAAELVGVARRALDLSVEHASTRRQFGQPIGAFQAVKHRLADCYVAVERARGLVYLAAHTRTWQSAVLAKAAAGDAALLATRSCVAVHGAIAQTWEHDAHLLLRRAWLASALLGGPDALYAEAGRDYLASAS